MTPEEIRKKRAALEKRREKYFIEKYKLEDACPHESAVKKSKGSTGNYDPSSDMYWIEFTCPIVVNFGSKRNDTSSKD